MQRSQNNDKFLDIISRFNDKIITLGSNNLLSNHVYSENFFRDLLNLLYNLKLKNMNYYKSNMPGIDLIDEFNKVIVQVTATATKAKVEKTINNNIVVDKLSEGYRILFVFIGEQNINLKKSKFTVEINQNFNPQEDLLFSKNLNNSFINKSISEQEEILILLSKELTPLIYEERYNFIEEEFITKLIDISIKNLQSKYFEDNDVETSNNHIIEGIALSENFIKKITENNSKFLHILTKLKCDINNLFNETTDDIELECIDKLNINLQDLITQISLILEQELNLDFDFNILESIYKKLNNLSIYIEDENFYNLSDEQQITIYNSLKDFVKINEDNNAYLDKIIIESCAKPYLLIRGNAGIGKSHLMAHLAKNLKENNHITYLFLGQYFTENTNPWNQMKNYLDIETTFDEFLKVVNDKANELNKRSFLMIDALNEGNGPTLWSNSFVDFINRIKRYPNIALIITIRTPFDKHILPNEIIDQNNLTIYNHKGFSDDSYNAIISFCDYYNIELPNFPILNTEYENPLFLNLACQHFSNLNIKFSENLRLSYIFESLIERIENNLINIFEFDRSIKLIHNIVHSIANIMIERKSKVINYLEAYRTVREISKDDIDKPNLLLKQLINENLFVKGKDYNNQEVIQFSYDLMSEYFIIDSVLQKYKMLQNTEEILDKLNEDSKLNEFILSESYQSNNLGLLVELSRALAENFQLEIFDVIDDKNIKFNINYAFVSSLKWRTNESITARTLKFIDEKILIDRDLFHELFEVILTNISKVNSQLNARFLNDKLKLLPLTYRDYYWTQFISKNYEVVDKFFVWIYKHFNSLGYESANLYAILMTWICSSTNRKMRDNATKILVILFEKYPELIISILYMFRDNNDPYVLERLYAAIYGEVIRNKDLHVNREIALFIYNEIFDKKEVYPNILVRDYARQTIEFILSKEAIESIDYKKISPPYSSNWYDRPYSNTDIDLYIDDISSDISERERISLDIIKHSMTTEYGRGIGGYGDFGRYIFGHGVKSWVNQFDNDQILANYVIMRVFEMGYDPKLHAEFDLNVNSFERHNNVIERIGKKYQWIAYYELLGKLVDKLEIKVKESRPKTNEVKSKNDEDILFIDDIEHNIKELEQGQESSERKYIHENFEEILFELLSKKKNDKSKEKVKLITSEKQYNGPWELNVRNIDPSVTYLTSKMLGNDKIVTLIPSKPSIEWLNCEFEKQEFLKLIEIEFNDIEYVAVSVAHSEKSKNSRKVEYYYTAMGFFYKKANEKNILETNKRTYNNGVSAPSSFNIYLYEFYWSDAYKGYAEDYNLDEELYFEASHQYLWEEDKSLKDDFISLLIPGKLLTEYFDLSQEHEGRWVNKQKETICLNTLLLGYSTEMLLIKKEKLIEFMEENELHLGWRVFAEKIFEENIHSSWFNIFYNEGIIDLSLFDNDIYQYKSDRY